MFSDVTNSVSDVKSLYQISCADVITSVSDKSLTAVYAVSYSILCDE